MVGLLLLNKESGPKSQKNSMVIMLFISTIVYILIPCG